MDLAYLQGDGRAYVMGTGDGSDELGIDSHPPAARRRLGGSSDEEGEYASDAQPAGEEGDGSLERMTDEEAAQEEERMEKDDTPTDHRILATDTSLSAQELKVKEAEAVLAEAAARKAKGKRDEQLANELKKAQKARREADARSGKLEKMLEKLTARLKSVEDHVKSSSEVDESAAAEARAREERDLHVHQGEDEHGEQILDDHVDQVVTPPAAPEVEYDINAGVDAEFVVVQNYQAGVPADKKDSSLPDNERRSFNRVAVRTDMALSSEFSGMLEFTESADGKQVDILELKAQRRSGGLDRVLEFGRASNNGVSRWLVHKTMEAKGYKKWLDKLRAKKEQGGASIKWQLMKDVTNCLDTFVKRRSPPGARCLVVVNKTGDGWMMIQSKDHRAISAVHEVFEEGGTPRELVIVKPKLNEYGNTLTYRKYWTKREL